MAEKTRRRQVPDSIEVRGARVHNLKDIDVSVPLNNFVGIAGVSGSGKSSLALGVLYAEGSRRYLEALSTYTRRRITQSERADVDEVEHVPSALALHQRPAVPDIRSTFGTMTELLNGLRLLYSRTGSYTCPNGHRVPPTMNVALERPIVCSQCHAEFYGRGAEEMAFNSDGACPACSGTGVQRVVDESTLVPDESLSIDDGAVAPWGTLMWSLMKDIVRQMGVRTDIPFRELNAQERQIVFHGPTEKHHIVVHNKGTDTATELDFTYYSAVKSVENALSRATSESAVKRVSRFLKEQTCPQCAGTRLCEAARDPIIKGINLPQACAMTLDEFAVWLADIPSVMPVDVAGMATNIIDTMREPVARLQQLGLGYLSLDRPGATLSTGERQRVQLSRAVRNRTTGVLYVLDEPSIGLHPANVDGLLGVIDNLLANGNSVVVVDHDARVLRQADHIIEIGPGSGDAGGRVIAQGSVAQVAATAESRIGGFLDGSRSVHPRQRASERDMFALGAITMSTSPIHTVSSLDVRIPLGRLTAVTGVSGSGKTTMVLESLIPALERHTAGQALPEHVRGINPAGIEQVHLIDSTPIGANIRSTVATYSGVLDPLRRVFAATDTARSRGLHAGDFSYNTGSLRCPTCDGTGTISLDVQFLPDAEITCPDCRGSRYGHDAWEITRTFTGKDKQHPVTMSLPQLMAMTIDDAMGCLVSQRKIVAKLKTLHDLGIGYLTLGEATPALSGGEAQRLKLAGQIGKDQRHALFVFDEPTIGLHPLDVEVLIGVLQNLLDCGATIIVIEHDLDMIANADWIIDMGPGGGSYGGRIVCAGTPEQVAATPASVTGRYL